MSSPQPVYLKPWGHRVPLLWALAPSGTALCPEPRRPTASSRPLSGEPARRVRLLKAAPFRLAVSHSLPPSPQRRRPSLVSRLTLRFPTPEMFRNLPQAGLAFLDSFAGTDLPPPPAPFPSATLFVPPPSSLLPLSVPPSFFLFSYGLLSPLIVQEKQNKNFKERKKVVKLRAQRPISHEILLGHHHHGDRADVIQGPKVRPGPALLLATGLGLEWEEAGEGLEQSACQ